MNDATEKDLALLDNKYLSSSEKLTVLISWGKVDTSSEGVEAMNRSNIYKINDEFVTYIDEEPEQLDKYTLLRYLSQEAFYDLTKYYFLGDDID